MGGRGDLWGHDYATVRDRIDIMTVAFSLMGQACSRKGSRLLWLCPFHDDHHPSFEVNVVRKTWRCWACGVGGDAAELVKRVKQCRFPEAVKYLSSLAGMDALESKPMVLIPVIKSKSPERPTGLPLTESLTLVEEGIHRLWGPNGANAMDYLHGRGLTDETIRDRKLGFTPCVTISTRDGDRCFRFSGVIIPWFDGERLTRIKIRRLDDGKPKYAEAYSDQPLIYPDPVAIEPGRPLIISEGEFDAVLLGQQLPEASVITLGSASARTDPVVVRKMLSSPRWFVALHADQAGDSAAAKFPARAIRVRPPGPGKDWGDVHAWGFNRIRYHWGRYLAMGDHNEKTSHTYEGWSDSYAEDERAAIQSEPHL